MTSTGTIIAHGSTPTGFGIRQRSNGTLRALSRCCGRMISSAGYCHGCSFNYKAEEKSMDAWLGVNVPLGNPCLRTWVSNVTGYSEVKVSIR